MRVDEALLEHLVAGDPARSGALPRLAEAAQQCEAAARPSQYRDNSDPTYHVPDNSLTLRAAGYGGF